MLRFLSSSLFLMLMILLTGCNDTSSQSKAVAIVDLEKVLKLTGLDLKINNAVQEREQQLRSGLNNFQQKLDELWLAKKKEFGETPTEQQIQELEAFRNQLSMENQQAKNQANRDITAFQQDLISTFQEQVSPVSLEVAKEQGYLVVLGQNPSILAFDTTIDITDAVIERMKQVGTEQNGEAGSTIPGTAVPITPPMKSAPSTTPSLTPQITPPATPAQPPKTEAPKTETPKTETPAAEPAPATPAPEVKTPAATPPEMPAKPAEEKPAAEKPETTTPEPAKTEEKPVEEAKPAEEKPAAETTPE